MSGEGGVGGGFSFGFGEGESGGVGGSARLTFSAGEQWYIFLADEITNRALFPAQPEIKSPPDRLLSSAPADFLSAQDGWTANPFTRDQNANPFTTSQQANLLASPMDEALFPKIEVPADRLLSSAPADFLSAQGGWTVNPFIHDRNANPFISSQLTGSLASPDLNASNGPIQESSGLTADQVGTLIAGSAPVDTAEVDGRYYARFVVNIGGERTYLYYSDMPQKWWTDPVVLSPATMPPTQIEQSVPAAPPTSVPSDPLPTSSPPPTDALLLFRALSDLWLGSLHIPPAPSLRQIGDFGVGVARGVEDALTPLGVGGMLPTPMDTSKPFELGRGLGQIGAGIGEMFVGGGGELLGTLLDATGIGTLVGVPVNVLSAGLILQGGTAGLVGARNLGHAMSSLGDGTSGSAQGGGAGAAGDPAKATAAPRGGGPYQPPSVRPPREVKTPSGKTVLDPGFEGRRPDDPWRGIWQRNAFEWSDVNIREMLNGRPPWGRDGEKIQLHHRAQQPNGPLDEYTATLHRQQGMHSDELSQINRRLFEEQRARYWVSRARRQLGLE